MTRIGLVFIVLTVLAALATIMILADKQDSKIADYKLNIEWHRAMKNDAINEISSLKQELKIERIKNTEKDSILVVYKESMKVHSSGLQDANWRLIQLKRLIEDAKEE